VGLFRTKSIDALIAASEDPEKKLRRTLGPWSLTAFGIGAVIGSGIFILTGTAAAGETLHYKSILHAPVMDLMLHGSHALSTIGRPGAGPGISLSFLLTALACSFAALCYAELASMIPIAGSAYTYAYATLGELIAWIIGWDLILEYAVSNMAVAAGFSGYLQDVLENLFGLHLPAKLSMPPIVGDHFTGAWFNLPALIVLLVLTYILVIGVRESAGTNNAMGRKHRQLASLPAQRLFRRAHRLGHRVLHLHRLRFGFHGGRGVPEPAARPALRHHHDAGDLRRAVYLGGAGVDGHRSVEEPDRRGARGRRAQGPGIQRHSPVGEYRRHLGDDLLAAGISIRAGAHLVCDVARRSAAESILESTPGL
jgi:hypothetical protein